MDEDGAVVPYACALDEGDRHGEVWHDLLSVRVAEWQAEVFNARSAGGLLLEKVGDAALGARHGAVQNVTHVERVQACPVTRKRLVADVHPWPRHARKLNAFL